MPGEDQKPDRETSRENLSAREALTFYNPREEREADRAPLQLALIRRIFGYTNPYAARRNWLFTLTFIRGLQLPALAWLIGRTITGPIANRDVSGIFRYAAGYFLLALVTVLTFHFRQRFALELGEAVVHDMRSDLFRKLMTMPMSFFNRTKFGRIISRLTSDIDSVRAGVQDVAFVLVVQCLQMAGSAALMAWYNWKLFCLMVVLAPVIWVVNENYRKEMSRRLRKVQQSWSRVYLHPGRIGERHPGDAGVCAAGINAGFFRKLINVHGENNVGVAQASAVFVPLAAVEEPAVSRRDGAVERVWGVELARLDAHGGGRPGDVLFPGQPLLRPGPGDRQSIEPGVDGDGRGGTAVPDAGPETGMAGCGGRQTAAGHRRPRGISGGPFRISTGPARAPGHHLHGRAGPNRGAGGTHRQRQDHAGGLVAEILSAHERVRAGGWSRT